MAVTAIGKVYLGGVQFTTDPQDYRPFTWPKRASIHPGVQGAFTIQDFGLWKKDNLVVLGSGGAGYMEELVVKSLHTKYQTRGATYTLTDWMGNEYTCWIEDFQPVPTFQGTLYTYTMQLRVLNIVKLWGATYSGS
jgi:hypothetical protein